MVRADAIPASAPSPQRRPRRRRDPTHSQSGSAASRGRSLAEAKLDGSSSRSSDDRPYPNLACLCLRIPAPSQSLHTCRADASTVDESGRCCAARGCVMGSERPRCACAPYEIPVVHGGGMEGGAEAKEEHSSAAWRTEVEEREGATARWRGRAWRLRLLRGCRESAALVWGVGGLIRAGASVSLQSCRPAGGPPVSLARLGRPRFPRGEVWLRSYRPLSGGRCESWRG